MTEIKFLYLSQEDVVRAGVLDMARTLEDIEKVFRLYAEDKVIMPAKNLIDFYDDHEYRGHIVSMPCYVGDDIDVVGIKWAAGFPKNPIRYDLPLGIDVIILSDPHSGRPLAIMDGTIITAMRTSAVTGIAIRYLARADSEHVAVIGAGVIGRTTLMALPHVLPKLKEVRLYDIRREKSELLARDFKGELPVMVSKSLDKAVRGADVVVTATTSRNKFVRSEWISKGCLCVQVGTNEFSEEVVLRADKVVVDNWEQIRKYGKSMLCKLYEEGYIKRVLELPFIVAGKQPGRESPEELIFFDSFGMACEDIIVAYRIYKNAIQQGLGEYLYLWRKPLWK